MEKIKIITLCGSLKYIEKMWEVAEKLSLEKGYAVIGVNPHVIGRPLTEDEISTMKRNEKKVRRVMTGGTAIGSATIGSTPLMAFSSFLILSAMILGFVELIVMG